MKTIILILAFATMIVGSAFTPVDVKNASIQEVKETKQNFLSSFDFFRVHRQGKAGATATWGMSAASGVTGFSVERTYEDPSDPYANWEVVSMTAYTGARSYKVTDTNIFPGFIHYRVKATMANGDEIASGVKTVHIVQH